MKSILVLLLFTITFQIQAQKTVDHTYTKKVKNLCNERSSGDSTTYFIKYPKGKNNLNKAVLKSDLDSITILLNEDLSNLDFHRRYMLKYKYEIFINCKGELVGNSGSMLNTNFNTKNHDKCISSINKYFNPQKFSWSAGMEDGNPIDSKLQVKLKIRRGELASYKVMK